MSNNYNYYIKTILLSLLLFAESYALTYAINYYVEDQKFFQFDQRFTFFTIIFLYLILMTNALLVGAWRSWEQYLVTPIPVSCGIFMGLLLTNSAYAVVIAFSVYLLLCYDAFLASRLKDQLIKFNPHLILKFASRGLIFSFSIIPAAILLIANPDQRHVNIGDYIGDLAETVAKKYVVPNINTQIQNEMGAPNLQQLGIEGTENIELPLNFNVEQIISENLSIKDTVEKEVNKVVTPYKRFINPLIAVFLFWMVQLYGFISKILFNISVSIVYSLAKKSRLFHVSTEMVEREIIRF